jgi:hypothetical protein
MAKGVYTRTATHLLNMSLCRRGEKAEWWGKKHSTETKAKMSNAAKGRILTEEHRRKIGESNKGEKSGNWKGGITKLNTQLRNTFTKYI